MELDELRLLRLHAQHLLSPVGAHQAASDLCGFQAQFLRNAVHALRLRSSALRTEGLVKTWTLRGTVHLLPEGDLPLFIRRCGKADDVCESEWYRWRSGQGNAPAPEREKLFAHRIVQGVAEGADDRESLRRLLQDAGMTPQEESHVFDPWGGLIRELAETGVIGFRVDMADVVRPVEDKRYRLLPQFVPMEERAASVEILRRYLTHYGPVTLRDAAYFFRWTQSEICALLDELPVDSVTCGGRACLFLPGERPSGGLPDVILLAGFDPLMLGYRKEDSVFLTPDSSGRSPLRGIFNLAGIIHPAILLRGRVVGRWKEKDGKVGFTAFEPLCAPDKYLIEQEAARLFNVKTISWAE